MLRACSVHNFRYQSPRIPTQTALALDHVVEIHRPTAIGNAIYSSYPGQPPRFGTVFWFSNDFMHSFTVDPAQDLSIIVADSWSRRR